MTIAHEYKIGDFVIQNAIGKLDKGRSPLMGEVCEVSILSNEHNKYTIIYNIRCGTTVMKLPQEELLSLKVITDEAEELAATEDAELFE